MKEFHFAPLLPVPGTYIALDASLWGGGGILVVGHRVVEWFATQWTAFDHAVHHIAREDSGNMSYWESLTILIACREWLVRFLGMPVVLKSGSLSALRLALKLGSRSKNLNLIGYEFALDQALGRYQIKLLEHVPGVSNITPDGLSRQFAPTPSAFPIACLNAIECCVKPRDSFFWKCTKNTAASIWYYK